MACTRWGEQQFDADEAFALAGLAAALCNVERESAGVVAPGLGLFGSGKKLADVIEQSGICRQVRAGRPMAFWSTTTSRLMLSRPVMSPAVVTTGASSASASSEAVSLR